MYRSWIQRWFFKQEDFVLWAIFITWWIIQFTVAFAIATAIAKAIFL